MKRPSGLLAIMNALMVIPNMIALLGLSGIIKKETDLFLAEEGKSGKEAVQALA